MDKKSVFELEEDRDNAVEQLSHLEYAMSELKEAVGYVDLLDDSFSNKVYDLKEAVGKALNLTDTLMDECKEYIAAAEDDITEAEMSDDC